MGRGFYLQAGSTYSGWRVCKESLQYARGELLAKLEVPAPPVVAELPAAPPADAPTPEPAARLEERADRGSLWLRFAQRPADATLFALKGAGWRWSRPAMAWYHQLTPANRVFAEQFTGVTTVEETDAPAPAEETSSALPVATVLPFEARR